MPSVHQIGLSESGPHRTRSRGWDRNRAARVPTHGTIDFITRKIPSNTRTRNFGFCGSCPKYARTKCSVIYILFSVLNNLFCYGPQSRRKC